MRDRARYLVTVGTVVALSAAGIALSGDASWTEVESAAEIDTYPARTRVTGCADPLVARPGVADFRRLILSNVGGGDDGLEVCKKIANNSGSYSDHADGRAWDWHVHASDADDSAMVDRVLDWLLRPDERGNRNAMARRFGITYIIWNHKYYRVGGDDAQWVPYTGTSDPHDTHVHFSFSVAGADRQTSWWTEREALTWFLPSEPEPIVYGAGTARPVVGDWDGDGRDSVGIYDVETRRFMVPVSNSPHGGRRAMTPPVGPLGGMPLAGDWDGDGVDEVGVYEPATKRFSFYTLDGHRARPPVEFGAPGDLPIVGDWDGDGVDDVGTYSPEYRTYSLRSPDGSVESRTFGPPGVTPVVGDWDADGVDEPGLFRLADRTFLIPPDGRRGARAISTPHRGPGRHLPVVGDWDGDGRDNHGVVLSR